MTKMIIRFLLTCILLSIIIGLILIKTYESLQFNNLCADVKRREPVLSLLNTYLSPYPVNQWQAIIKQNSPDLKSINLLKINELHFNEQQKERLNANKWVCEKNPIYSEFEAAYKRSPNPNYIYQVYDDLNDADTAQFKIALPEKLIEKNLMKLPQKDWANYIAEFSKNMGIPISVHSLSSLTIPEKEMAQLNNDHWIVDFPKGNSSINTAYTRISNTNYVMQYGPFSIPFANVYSRYFIFFYLFILAEVIALLFAFLFAYSLGKLNKLAHEYGEGNFKSKLTLSSSSILLPLFKNLKFMGKRIQSLMASQKEISHVIAHELRTPISRLRFSLELLESSQDINQISARKKMMEEDIDELEELVSEILFYAQLDRVVQATDLSKIVISNLIKPLLEKFPKEFQNKKLEVNLPKEADHWIIQTNAKYFTRAIQNILKNAARFAKAEVRFSLIKIDSSHLQLIIEDDGPGISPEDREKIFTPFSQLDNQFSDESEGYGLGLAITKKIVDQYGWTISVDDSELGGAKFIIAIAYLGHM